MVNIAVIGCGYWGPNLIRNFYQIENSHLKFICDSNEARLNSIGRMYPHVAKTTNYKDVLNSKEVDAVVIATPIHTHHPLAKEALEAGKHILIEKPMTKSSMEAKELIDLAEKKGKILMVGHTFEYSPSVNKVKELLTGGTVGKLAHIEARRHNLGRLQSDYNVVWDLAPHDISILLYTTGSAVDKVRAITHKGYLINNTDSIAQIDVMLKNNVSAHLSMSWLYPKKMRDMTFIGDKKMIFYDDTDPVEKIRIYDKGVDNKFDVGEVAVSNTIYREGDVYIPHVSSVEPLRLECADFVESISKNKKPMAHGNSGLQVVKVLEAIEKSASTGGHWVSIEE